MDDPRKLSLTCFSRESTDVYHSYKNFLRKEKDQLVITACNPIKILPRDLGFPEQYKKLVRQRSEPCKTALQQSKSSLPKDKRKLKGYTDRDSRIGFSAMLNKRNSSILSYPIFLILGHLRSANFESLTSAQNRLMKHDRYIY